MPTETKVNPTTYSSVDFKDKATDNLWKTQEDSSVYQLMGNKPKKMEKKAGNVSVSANTKVEGTIVYFLPKDESGKLLSSPQRFLRVSKDGSNTSYYIKADKVVPFLDSASSFTALDDIANEINDGGYELSNACGLDDGVSELISSRAYKKERQSGLTNESLLNIAGRGNAKALFNAGRFVKNPMKSWYNRVGTYPKDTVKAVVDIRLVNVVNEKSGLIEGRNLLIFEDGTAGLPNAWKNISGGSSRADGHDDEFDNLTNESLLNADGGWFGNLFKSKKKKALKVISDPNVAVVDSATMQQAYKESASGKSFKDWVNSDSGRAIVDSISQLANVIVNRPFDPTTQSGNVGSGNTPIPPAPSETKILGMSPVVFGIVALGVIAIGAVVTIKIIKAQKGKIK